jgi:putative protease
MSGKRIELLAPARTADSGIIAIQSGADAVYIGAPRFSARAAVGTTVQDIERLTAYAHQFHARVYVALNTILFDYEMESARQMIH